PIGAINRTVLATNEKRHLSAKKKPHMAVRRKKILKIGLFYVEGRSDRGHSRRNRTVLVICDRTQCINPFKPDLAPRLGVVSLVHGRFLYDVEQVMRNGYSRVGGFDQGSDTRNDRGSHGSAGPKGIAAAGNGTD